MKKVLSLADCCLPEVEMGTRTAAHFKALCFGEGLDVAAVVSLRRRRSRARSETSIAVGNFRAWTARNLSNVLDST